MTFGPLRGGKLEKLDLGPPVGSHPSTVVVREADVSRQRCDITCTIEPTECHFRGYDRVELGAAEYRH
jgi:hypothetical protein